MKTKSNTLPKDFQRIGIYGGSFDPIHNAHVAVAKHALLTLRLDVLYVVVAALSPLKSFSNASFADRCVMAQLAFADEPNIVVSDIEALREQPSYTIDTIEYFQHQTPDAELFLIIGEDTALDIAKWYRWQDILDLTHVVVSERGGYRKSQMQALVGEIGEDYTQKLMNNWLKFDHAPLSSTQIRLKLASQRRLNTIPEKAQDYIVANHLYQ